MPVTVRRALDGGYDLSDPRPPRWTVRAALAAYDEKPPVTPAPEPARRGFCRHAACEPHDRCQLVCAAPCEHVLCNPHAVTPVRYDPDSRPASAGWLDRLEDDAQIRALRAARLAAQAKGYGVLRDQYLGYVPTECGCPRGDGPLPDCYWTGDHSKRQR
jgi:hypothetical protein